MKKGINGSVHQKKTRPSVLIDSDLWTDFRAWAKEQGKTLPRATEDALRDTMVKQQAIDCIALDGKEDKEAGLNNFTSRPSDDKKTYYVKLVRGQVVGDFYIGVDHLTAEQARMGAQAAVNALNALKNKE